MFQRASPASTCRSCQTLGRTSEAVVAIGCVLMNLVDAFLVLACLVLAGSVNAQSTKLPPPTRTVFKCEIAGRITYSDEPCEGARKVDVQPTRGLNKSTGRELVGPDVAREQRREALSEALKPLTGMTPEQSEVQSRRARLPAHAKAECSTLDRSLPVVEGRELTTTGESKAAAQRELLGLRKRYKDLQC
jgi:hypothetical protein